MQREGIYTAVRPLNADDLPTIYSWVVSEQIAWSWYGEPVSSDGFARSVWQGAFQQGVVQSRDDGSLLGHLALYGADMHNQRCYVAVGYPEEYQRRGWPLEGLAMFLDWSFERFPFRKLYFEVFEQRMHQFSSVTSRGPIREEAVLEDYNFFRGKWSNVHVLSLRRDDWESSPLRRLGRTA